MCRSWYGTSSASVSAIRSSSASGLCSERTSWKTPASRRYDSTSASARVFGSRGSGAGSGRSAALLATSFPLSAAPSTWISRSRDSAEEVCLGGHDEVARGAAAGDRKAADDCDRDALDLAHRQLGGRRDLVGDRDQRRMELVAEGIVLPSQVAQHIDPGCADRDIDDPDAPGTAERVGDDDAELLSRSLLEPVAQPRSRRVGIFGQEDDGVRLGGVRGVDARRGTDEAVPG